MTVGLGDHERHERELQTGVDINGSRLSIVIRIFV